MTINKYGYKMAGLKKAAGETKQLSGRAGEYLELFYDKRTGEVWTKYQYSIGSNSWTVYHDPNIVKVCNVYIPKTMQQIADLIVDAMFDDLHQ